jgi:hypothetical protein
MKTIVRLEEFGIFLFAIYLFSTLAYPWWLFPLLLFVPDLSMVGYLKDTKVGAMVYNFFHFRGLALLLFVLGSFISLPLLSLIGVILFAHSSLDRVFGYGMKYGDSFENTHLGKIGRKSSAEDRVAA